MTTEAAFFERMYRGDELHDPWRFSSDHYERSRYDAVIDALGRAHYHRALEPGCSIGELSALLADRCDQVLAMDFAPTAIRVARRRHGDLRNVAFRCGSLPQDLGPSDVEFDLIVLSEIGYYFAADALTAMVRPLVERLVGGGELVAAHWTGISDDHVLGGEQVHDLLSEELHRLGVTTGDSSRRHHEGFIVDRWNLR